MLCILGMDVTCSRKKGYVSLRPREESGQKFTDN